MQKFMIRCGAFLTISNIKMICNFPAAKAVLSFVISYCLLTLSVPETKTAEFANSVDLNEVAHNEPSHLDLYCLSSSLPF